MCLFVDSMEGDGITALWKLSALPLRFGRGGTVRPMHHHAPSGTVRFGTDTNTIGRARLPRRGGE